MAVSLLDTSGELVSPPIWVDHNDPTPRLDASETQADLARNGIVLADGLRLLLYDDDAEDGKVDDLLAIGIVRFDGGLGRWVADISRDFADGAYVHFSGVDAATQVRWLRHRPENGQPYA
ncbi:MAG: hypothetical protein JJE46_00755 [Acidimicrobiia bacterium]|nr:hypothetical protein [Acidimicrobiia bacterium]